jgi:hypothetical protein
MKRRSWVLPLVFLLAYSDMGHIQCGESLACQQLDAQSFHHKV